ncbi:MAG: GAF domain-containing protein [Anaerolineae bacterium]|nr:GAF domain-containing protein [Anaerolineae bacterium]
MVRQDTPYISQSQRLRQRAANRIMLIMLVLFGLIGLVGLLVVRANALDNLERTHIEDLQVASQDIRARLNQTFDDVRFLADSSTVRTFAGATTNEQAIQTAQSLLAQTFATTLARNPVDYLALRYVDPNGTVWMEVRQVDGTPQISPAADTPSQANDAAFVQGMETPLNEVSTSELRFLTYAASDDLVEPLTPYIRFTAPTSAETSSMNIAGMVQLDVALTQILDIITADEMTNGIEGRRLVLVDDQGNLLADTSLADSNILRRLANGFGVSLESQFPIVANTLGTDSSMSAQISEGRMISVLPLAITGPDGRSWSLLLLDDVSETLNTAMTTGLLVLVGSIIFGGLVGASLQSVLRSSLRPLDQTSSLAMQIAKSNIDSVQQGGAEFSGSETEDEITRAFDKLRRQVQTLSRALDMRTEHYQHNLEIAARISRETAMLHDIDLLINRTLDLICNEFGYYHAQVFLVDDAGMNAVLRYSHGSAGDILLEQGHKLPVGSESVIGQVTALGEAVIVNDTGSAERGPHHFNPLLSTTQAEMALPLTVGSRAIGALDIQSETPDAFREDELQIFQLLADQLAIAIQNARLLIETEARVEQIDRLNQQFIRSAWQRTMESGEVDESYHYDLMQVAPGKAKETGEILRVPLTIRGVVIGELEAAADLTHGLTEGDEAFMRAIADRVGLAIENARLLGETQNTLAETFSLYELSRALSEATSLEDVIRATMETVVPEATGGQIGIFSVDKNDITQVLLEITQAWTRRDYENAIGAVLPLNDASLLTSMTPDQVILVQDVAHDQRLDAELRALLENTLGARAAVHIPINVRGSLRGVLTLGFPTARTFSQRDGRLFAALIDQAGVAIDNRLLLIQNEMALAQIERLYDGSRVVNMARSVQDVLRAAVVTNKDRRVRFELALLEGALDETGWSTQMRIVARGQDNDVAPADDVFPLHVAEASQLRQREPQPLRTDARVPGGDDFASLMSNRHYQTGVAFPLFNVNQPVAIFFAASGEAVDFSSEEFEIYRALTGQMSTVLQNRRLLEQTERALDETRRLYEAIRGIAGAQDATTVYETTADHLIAAAKDMSRMSILLVPEGNAQASQSPVDYDYIWSRNPQPGSGIQIGTRLSDALVDFGHLFDEMDSTIYIRSTETELSGQESFDGLREVLERSGSRSAMIVKLQTRQNWLGVLLLESDQPGAFSTGFAPFAQAIGDQVATAIDSLQSFEEAQSQARRALALVEVGQLANRIGGELAPSLQEVFRRVAEAANYSSWQLLLVDEEETRLQELISQIGPEQGDVFPNTHDLLADSQHSIVDAYHSGAPIIVNHPVDYSAFRDLKPEQLVNLGKHIVAPVVLGHERFGVLMAGRHANEASLAERDEQLVLTLAAQVAVALENRRLLRTTESEKERLGLILETLPAGVMVLDPHTLRPVQTNQQAETLLGRPIDQETAFTIEDFKLYRTGTNALYPAAEMPVFTALSNQRQEFCDDITVYHDDGGQIDLLVNAAPILNEHGQIAAIVVAFQDISTLRTLENTLQENLRETIMLYETTRSLAEAAEIDDVLDLMMVQLSMQEAADAYIVMLDDNATIPRVVRSLSGVEGEFPLPLNLLTVRRPLFIGDVNDELQLDDEALRTALADQGMRALIVEPLRAQFRGSTPRGWAVLTFTEPQDFAIEREQSLNTLIDSVAVTLDNRYLFQSTQVALDTTAALYTATAAINRTQDLNELQTAIQDALQWLKSDIYAAYVRSGDALNALVNVNLDGGEIDFGALLETHQPMTSLFIEDLPALSAPPPFEQALVSLGTLRTLALVPIRLQARAGGYLLVAYHHPRAFSEGEKRYLSAIADGSSIMLDNLLLLDQIQESLQETSVLYLSSRELSDALNEEDIVQVIVNHLLDRPANQVIVCSYGNIAGEVSDDVLRVVAHWQGETDNAIDIKGITFAPDTFPAWRIITNEDLMLIDNVDEDERLTEAERMGLQSLGLQSVSVLPLSGRTQRLGAILIGDNVQFKHSDREERIYGSFAEQASLRLEASRLLIQTERRARQLTTSARVGQLSSSLEELSSLLPTIVELIKEAFGYDHAQIFLMDEAERFAVLAASTGEAGQQLLATNHRLEKGSQSVIGQVTATGEPVLALDTSVTGAVHRPNRYLPNTRAEIAVPLVLKGRVVGALDVQSNVANYFTQDDISVLTTLAAQISIAIDNAALYEESQARAKDMYFLFTVATAAAGADTLDETMQNITLALQELLEAAAVSIYLPIILTDGETTITELRPVAIAGSDMPLSEISEIRLGRVDTLLGRAASELRPYIISNVSDEQDYMPIIGDAQSAIIVPLSVGNRLISLLTMESRETNAYDDDTLTLLLTLSGTLSAIVQSQQLLEELQRTNEQLLELDRLKSDFLANMSHELRTPLNSIIGFSRVILKGIDGPLTELQEQDLTTIYNSGQHLLNLINDILDQAKIAAGKMDLQSDYFDIKPVIESVRSIGIGLVKDKPIDIIVHMAPGLPKAFGDEFRTRQVLLNLVSNAAKFTKEGSITINTYTHEDENGEGFVWVEVTDTGIGISESDLPLLFEAFRQIDSSLTKTQSGTGLGLPIAKSLVEMQGGQMTVESQVNVGSTFTITIPLTPPVPQPKSTQEMRAATGVDPKGVNGSQPPTSKAPVPEIEDDEPEEVEPPPSQETEKQPVLANRPKPIYAKRQVLLIEDNPDMVDQFRRTLQREGFDVFTASIALEAQAMASGLHPSLIILDANFAGDKGWDLLEHLQQRDDTADIPVIIVALEDQSSRALEKGAFKFIRKPFMPEVLMQAAKDAETEAERDRILIIDDEPDSVRLLHNLLADAGKYRIFYAANGVEGVSMVARRRPDLVIVDLRMPEMDGFQVIQELRGNPETAEIPIMVVTGDTLNQTEMMQLSVLKVIYKPDLDAQGHRQFVDTVKQHLSTTNGEH